MCIFDRFLQKCPSSSLESVFRTRKSIPARNDHHRDSSRVIVCSQLLQEGKTIARWQSEIQNNQIRLLHSGFIDAGHAIYCKYNVIVVFR